MLKIKARMPENFGEKVETPRAVEAFLGVSGLETYKSPEGVVRLLVPARSFAESAQYYDKVEAAINEAEGVNQRRTEIAEMPVRTSVFPVRASAVIRLTQAQYDMLAMRR